LKIQLAVLIPTTNTADPSANSGAKTLLDVDAATQTTYIQLNLSPIPPGYNNDVDGAQTDYSFQRAPNHCA
jgi:hypothetical protein